MKWSDILDITWEKLLLYIILLAIGILIYIGKNSIPKYLQQKGQNLAQKQDIENLTQLVKNVEQTFIEKTEKLKHQLNVNKELHVALHSEERKTLIELHAALFYYFMRITDLSAGGRQFETNDEARSLRLEINNAYEEIKSRQSKIELFIDDDRIREKLGEIIMLFLQQVVPKFNDYINSILRLNVEMNVRDTTELIRQYYSEHNRIFNTYHESVLEIIKIVTPPLSEFTMIIKEYLKTKTNPL